MQSSKLGYRVWAIAIYLFNTNLKGTSSMKLHRNHASPNSNEASTTTTASPPATTSGSTPTKLQFDKNRSIGELPQHPLVAVVFSEKPDKTARDDPHRSPPTLPGAVLSWLSMTGTVTLGCQS